MSEPLKGGLSSFANATPFNPPVTAGSTPSNGLFGNTASAANTGTSVPSAGTQSAFGSGSGNLFGNFGSKPPATGSLFGGGVASVTSSPAPAAGVGTNPFSGFGAAPGQSSAAPNTSAAPATAPAPAFGGGLFGAKPAEQSTNAGASATSKPAGGLFGGFGGNSAGTAATQPASTTTSTAPNFFAKPAEMNASTTASASAAPAGGSLFGNNIFGKKSDAPATSNAAPELTTSAAPPLFGGLGAKQDGGAEKDKEKASTPAPPATGGLFGQAASGKDAPAASGSAFNLFGQKPAEKKETPIEGEKKDGTAAPGASALGATALGKPSGTNTPTPTGVSVPPPSMLRGKTIEEIVNKWSSELETHVREFNRLAGEVAVWDRALIDNGNTIAALFQHVLMAEREQSDIEQSLKHVEDQQKELASTLEVYEKAAGEIFDGQGGGLRALDVGPADAERDKHYTLAADLNANLDDLSRSLMQMIDSVNTLSEPHEGADRVDGDGGKTKGDAPLEQIAQILSSHLESLQWIDGAVREVNSKVSDVERLVRDASSNGTRNGNTTNSLAGSIGGTKGMSRSRGFGFR